MQQEILFFPPARLRVSSQRISDLIEGFDYTKLPQTSTFPYRGQQRKSMRIEVDKLSYESLADHCNYYGKSFSTAIMQSLVMAGVWKHD
jgi:hypothetical protein